MNTTLIMLFISTSHTLNLPPKLLSSLCYVESHHKVSAIHHDDGNGDSLGVCQIKYNTAKLLGFKGTTAQLMDPAINVKYAGLYLSKQITRYEGNYAKAVSAYNAGIYRPGTTAFAKNQQYVNKVFKTWAANK